MFEQIDNELTHSTPRHPEPYNLSNNTTSDTLKINNNISGAEDRGMPIANEAEERFKELSTPHGRLGTEVINSLHQLYSDFQLHTAD